MNNEIDLSDLFIGCWLHEIITRYDKSYLEVRQLNSFDFEKSDHIKKLFNWLRGWNCRQFKKEDEKLASKELLSWYWTNKKTILKFKKISLLDSSEKNFNDVSIFYNELANLQASKRIFKSRTSSNVKFGEVGAAKILFIYNPDYFAPWDQPIIKHFTKMHGAIEYSDYLKFVKSALLHLKIELEKKKLELNRLPVYLGRETSSLPKIIDEYFWVTITKGNKHGNVIEMFNQRLNLHLKNFG